MEAPLRPFSAKLSVSSAEAPQLPSFDAGGEVGVKKGDLKAFAADAFNRQRILINNMRKLDLNDIVKIYEAAL